MRRERQLWIRVIREFESAYLALGKVGNLQDFARGHCDGY